jgi:hypothetical protein
MSKLNDDPAEFRSSAVTKTSMDEIDDLRRNKRKKLIKYIKAAMGFVFVVQQWLGRIDKIYEWLKDFFE